MNALRAAAASALYHQLLEKEYLASTQDALSSAMERMNLMFDGRPICSVLHPH